MTFRQYSPWGSYEDHAHGGASIPWGAATQELALGALDEQVATPYIKCLLRVGAPASRAQAFREALGFAQHVFEFSGLAAILASGRFKGAVFR